MTLFDTLLIHHSHAKRPMLSFDRIFARCAPCRDMPRDRHLLIRQAEHGGRPPFTCLREHCPLSLDKQVYVSFNFMVRRKKLYREKEHAHKTEVIFVDSKVRRKEGCSEMCRLGHRYLPCTLRMIQCQNGNQMTLTCTPVKKQSEYFDQPATSYLCDFTLELISITKPVDWNGIRPPHKVGAVLLKQYLFHLHLGCRFLVLLPPCRKIPLHVCSCSWVWTAEQKCQNMGSTSTLRQRKGRAPRITPYHHMTM